MISPRSLLAAFAAAAVATACAPTSDRAVLATLRAEMAQQYHDCVPLGWNPVPASGTYYPGTNVELQEEGVWFSALWIASVDARSLQRADVRATVDVLDRLTQLGMVEKRQRGRSAQFRLTPRAMPYFFAENRFGDNPEAFPYLCYSTIVPQRIVWNHGDRPEVRASGARAFEAAFAWSASPAAVWANDPVVRSHSVILGPTQSPTVATLVQQGGGDWNVAKLGSSEPPLGRVVDAAVWPRPAF